MLVLKFKDILVEAGISLIKTEIENEQGTHYLGYRFLVLDVAARDCSICLFLSALKRTVQCWVLDKIFLMIKIKEFSRCS